MIIRVLIRGYGDGQKIFEDSIEVPDADLEFFVGSLAESHMAFLSKYDRIMLEFEFPDAPEGERFLRFGNDPSRMVMPIEVRL